MTATTIPAPTSRRSVVRYPGLWRTGAAAGAAAAALTTAVAAAARAADIPLSIDGESIPIAGFAQLTFVAAMIGVVLAKLIGRRAVAPRRTFRTVTVVLTALSLVPDLAVDATVGSKIVLMLTHLAAAAVVIPALARHIDR